jgi:FkbM family methyltransferase
MSRSRLARALRSGRTASARRALTAPARRVAIPVLNGPGRGLRVRFGETDISRAVGPLEAEAEDAFLGLLRPGDVVYDIGANIGWYSLLAARCVGSAGHVVAFEPRLENAACVQRNAATNRFANLTVVPAAVSDRDGWATFLDKGSLRSRLDTDGAAPGGNKRGPREPQTRAETVVPVLTLDSWIAQANQSQPNVIKMDVEGAEISALPGMSETLRSAMPTLIIELHGTGEAVADLLDGLNYEHRLIGSDTATRDARWRGHVLARPRPAA